jgi:hypothetical protein
MSRQISLTVSDDIFRRAEVMAGRSGRNVADVLTEAIEVSLDPLALAGADARPLTAWSDERVLAAADGAMPLAEDILLGELLERQQANTLEPEELETLRTLMHVYQEGLLTKAQGLSEAVRRGLRSAPLP